jgi:hypothetical protein
MAVPVYAGIINPQFLDDNKKSPFHPGYDVAHNGVMFTDDEDGRYHPHLLRFHPCTPYNWSDIVM